MRPHDGGWAGGGGGGVMAGDGLGGLGGGVGREGGGFMADDGLVELADAIGVVREQLVAAQTAGLQSAAQSLTFVVGKVTMEFAGEVKKTVGGSGGVKFWVVTAEAKAEQARG